MGIEPMTFLEYTRHYSNVSHPVFGLCGRRCAQEKIYLGVTVGLCVLALCETMMQWWSTDSALQVNPYTRHPNH